MASWAMHGTLVANTITTKTLDAAYRLVTVVNRSTSTDEITVQRAVGASDTYPVATLTAAADGAVVLAAGASYTFRDDQVSPGTPASKVQLISTGTPAFSVYGTN